ncbi:sugar O-acetyltransferase [Agarilytica rhodophyticola]|uniref:sugar O-acetyltransferase n=1 Tax=Agarilytica rhodophyticola TaxID=1737490 RepID=UPI000B34282B|nr:sugar O-acetyltransferase [Agarilytica rhodophyticola]
MTEKENMIHGLAYNSRDPILTQERLHAKSLCHQFNIYDPNKLEERMAILRQLILFKGTAHIEPNFFCDYGYNITIGDSFYANHNLTILDVCPVAIGDNVMLGPNVMISTATHPLNPIERKTTEYGTPIHIGDDVWIGGNAAVLPGVTIGNGSVIGASSVVTKDIPEGVLAFGNPCRVIRSIS